jgi:SpoVK/Ycf46/Vps4 family AAA+-type ATPase
MDIKETIDMIFSGTPAIHLCGDDYTQIDRLVKELSGALQYEILEWNFGYGLVEFETKRGRGEDETTFDAFFKSVCNPNFAGKKIVLLKNARFVLDGEGNTKNLARLQQTLIYIKANKQKTVVVYCDENQFIPDQLASLIHFVELKPPSLEELEAIVNKYVIDREIDFSAEKQKELASVCKGMSGDAFHQILERAALEKETFSGKVIEIAKKTKKQAVDKSRLVRLVEPEEGMDDIGGLGYLKWWLEQKQNAIFHPEEAKRHGVKPAKGILLVGMPGCGKSLSAKAIAKKFGLPLLNLDIGSLLGKYMGQSEEQLRRALRIAENASPCVLWVDEIEKAFAGVGGDETGVSQRLFGYLLTWLNEKTATVFVVATANDITILPHEIWRRGRFDEIFYVDFPTEPERVQILEIHLKKAKKLKPDEKLDEEIAKGLPELSKNMDGYTGSDIESLVNNAMETAWNNPGKTTSIIEILETQRKYIKPLKEVFKEKNAKNREKFGEYKLTSASFDEQAFDMDSSPNASPEKRIGAASNSMCPEKYLLRLAKDTDKNVLLALIGNPQCPSGVITELLDSVDEDVREKAKKRFFETEAGFIELAKTGTKEQKLSILKNIEKVSIDKRDEIFEIILKDDDRDVLLSLLHYPYLPEPVLTKLSISKNKDVRVAVLEHANCPKEVILKCLGENNVSDDEFAAAIKNEYTGRILNEIHQKFHCSLGSMFNSRYSLTYGASTYTIDWDRLRMCYSRTDVITDVKEALDKFSDKFNWR